MRGGVVVHLDDGGAVAAMGEGGGEGGEEFTVGDDDPRLAMVEDIADGCGVEAGVDGVQHAAGHGHAVMAFQHFGDIGQHGRNRIAAPQAALVQRMGELHAAGA